MFFNHSINELIQRQQKLVDSITIPVETASLVAEKLNGISLHYNNRMFETIQKQQTILSEITLPTVQVSLMSKMSKRLEQISSLLTQEISLINREVPLQLTNVLQGIDFYNFQNYIKPIQDSIREIVRDLNVSYIVEIQKGFSEIDFNTVHWSILDQQINEISDNEEIAFPTNQEIKETTKEILEESGIFQSQENIEQQLNTLIDSVVESKQPWYKAVFISIISAFVIFLLSPLLEPLQQEYNKFIQQNSGIIIKKMQNKVQEEFGDSHLLKEYKIISTQEMFVRITNKKNSSTVGQVYFGQLVRVVYKKRNWTFIQYENERGELIEGWVFTRYLSDVTY